MYIDSDVAYKTLKACVKGTKNFYNGIIKGTVKVSLENGYLVIKIKLPKNEQNKTKKK